MPHLKIGSLAIRQSDAMERAGGCMLSILDDAEIKAKVLIC